MTHEAPRPRRQAGSARARGGRAPVSGRRSALDVTRSRANGHGKTISISAGGVVLVIFLVLKVMGVKDRDERDQRRALGRGAAAAECSAGEEAVLRASRLRGVSGREREAAEAYEEAAKAWSACGARPEERACLASAGWAWLESGTDASTLSRAEGAFRAAANRFVLDPSPGTSASATVGLANVEMLRDTPESWERARSTLRKLLPRLVGQRDVEVWAIRATAELGWCLMPGTTGSDSYEEALAVYQEADQLASRAPADDADIAHWRSVIAYQIGYCLENREGGESSRAEARAHYERSVRAAHVSRDRVAEGQALSQLGASYEADREHERAASYYARAAEALRAGGDDLEAAAALGGQARSLAASGQLDAARPLFAQAESLYRAAGNDAAADEMRALREGEDVPTDDG